MKFEFVKTNEAEFPVRKMCESLEISRSGYYAWKDRDESPRAISNRELMADIREEFDRSEQTYGSPRVHRALRQRGVVCNEKRVARLMQCEGLISVHRQGFSPETTNSAHELPVAENLLQQDFSATAPNQKWVGDITYIATSEGWLYLAVIIDLFSRKVVGWAASASLRAELAVAALRMAAIRRGYPAEVVYHSDRGIQYASAEFRAALSELKATPSMSRRGNAYDNAVAESFYHSLKVERVHRRRYQSRAEARRCIADYIERFYNSDRLHSSIGYCSPVEFEMKAAA
jgi:transposase InsO family protein